MTRWQRAPGSRPLGIAEIAILLLGATTGWLILLTIRLNKIHWGPFAAFLTLVLGSSVVNFP